MPRTRKDPRVDETRTNEKRAPRVPMNAGGKLDVPVREGFQRYWQVDKPGLIEQMEAAWWSKVIEDGQPKTLPAGGGFTLYLMEIEQKYYNEDMEAQQQRNIDATQKQAQTLGEDEYVPMGRRSVAERDII